MVVLERAEPPAPARARWSSPRGGRHLRLGLPLLRRRAVRRRRRFAVPPRPGPRGRGARSSALGPGCREELEVGQRVALWPLHACGALLPVQRRPAEHVRQLRADRDPRRRRAAGAAGGRAGPGVPDRAPRTRRGRAGRAGVDRGPRRATAPRSSPASASSCSAPGRSASACPWSRVSAAPRCWSSTCRSAGWS